MATGHPNIVLGEALTTSGSAVEWTPGGDCVVFVAGTWDTATAELQVRARSTQDWITLDGWSTPKSANHVVALTLPSCELRLKINTPGSCDIDAYLLGFTE